jgi:hypothetical protein
VTRGESLLEVAVTLLRLAVLTAACAYLGLYLVLAWLRLPYPFELEWMEGGSLQHVARLLDGQGLYTAPRLDFIPYSYPPLYFELSAFVARITGPGFFPLRAVSFASSLACFLFIYELVLTETASRFCAVVATGLFAATFRVGGAWLDVARVDSLFLALFLAALLVLRQGVTARAYAAAGVLLGLSFLTKQTALAMGLPLVALETFSRPRLGAWLAASLAGVVAVSTAALHWASGGWYDYYVFRFPFLHPWVWSVLVTFWTKDILRPLPVAAAMAIASLVMLRPSRQRWLFWLMAAAGMVGGAYRSRLQAGGYDNVLLPAYAIIAILFGLALAAALRVVGERGARPRPVARLGIYAACLAQLVGLAYDPRAEVREAGEHALQALRAIEGDVLVPYHGYLAALSGRKPRAHLMMVFDVLKVQRPESEALAEEHRAAIRARRFRAIVLDEPEEYVFLPEVEASYVRDRVLFADPGVFFPVTGMRTRPQYVYVPRKPTTERSADVPPARH